MQDTQPDPEKLLQDFGFVRKLAGALIRDSELAEDVAQNAMLAALQEARSSPRGGQAWLRAVVRNMVRNHHRAKGRERGRDVDYLEMSRMKDSRDDGVEVERALERAEQRALVVDAVMALREPYRTVIVLRYFEETSPKDVAKALGRPLETVQTQIRRGLALLREELDEQHGGDRQAWAMLLAPLAGPHLKEATGLSSSALVVCTTVLVVGAGVTAIGAKAGMFDRGARQTSAEAPDASPSPSAEAVAASAHRESVTPLDLVIGSDGRSSADLGASTAADQIEPPRQPLRIVDADTGQALPGAKVLGYFMTAIDEDGLPSELVPPQASVSVLTLPAENFETDRIEFVAGSDGDVSVELADRWVLSMTVLHPGYVSQLLPPERLAGGVRVVALERAALLHLRRGDEAPGDALSVVIRNRFDGSCHCVEFDEGESSKTISCLPAGPFQLSVSAHGSNYFHGLPNGDRDAGASRLHQFVLATEGETTLVLFEPTGHQLLVKLAGVDLAGLDVSIKAMLVQDGHAAGLHSAADPQDDGHLLSRLELGPVEIRVLFGDRLVWARKVTIIKTLDGAPQELSVDLGAGRVEMCLEGLESLLSLSVFDGLQVPGALESFSVIPALGEHDGLDSVQVLDGIEGMAGSLGAAMEAAIGTAYLYGPLDVPPSQRQRIARPLSSPNVDGVVPGRYEAWVSVGRSVWREVVEVGSGVSTVAFDLSEKPGGLLSIQFDDSVAVTTQLTLRSSSGMELAIPSLLGEFLDVEALGPTGFMSGVARDALDIQLPVGSYGLGREWRDLTGAPDPVEVNSRTEMRLSDRSSLVSTQLIARFDGLPLSDGVLSIAGVASAMFGGVAMNQVIAFDRLGRATASLRPGSYRAIDVRGRHATFEVTENGGPVVIQLR